MDLIFEGRLSDQIAMQDILARIKSDQTPGLKILRVYRPRDGLSGKIAIDGGKYVMAATIQNSDESGYPALKKLLSMTDGNFAVLNAQPGDSIEFQPNLNIGLEQLLNTLPNLPEHPTKLFDERALLDRVFGQNFELSEEPRRQDPQDFNSFVPPLAAPGANMQGSAAWSLMQPLLEDESFPPGIITGKDVEEATAPARNARKTLTGSPSLRQSEFLSKETEVESQTNWPLIIAGIVLVIMAIAAAVFVFKH
ncbi:MAG: hypothetical protein IAF58_10930 [Leptolyngbya sp.]|nr:hypothetical protein [Candidatus Melainabacteria bacterium]